MGRNAKSDQVIRRVVLGREYEIYSLSFKGTQPTMTLLEKITLDKRPTEIEMIEKHNVEKVIIVATKIITGYYGVSIEEFMSLAKLVEKKEKLLTEDEKTAENINSEDEQN